MRILEFYYQDSHEKCIPVLSYVLILKVKNVKSWELHHLKLCIVLTDVGPYARKLKPNDSSYEIYIFRICWQWQFILYLNKSICAGA